MKKIVYCLLAGMMVALLMASACASSTPSTAAKKLVIATKQNGEAFELLSAGSQQPNIMNVIGNVYESLLAREPNATGLGKLVPGLAESWTVSPDGKMIEFNLRKGVKFQSGDPLTTADVKFSFDRLMLQPTSKSVYAQVDRIEVVNDYTFRVYFKAPDVTFIPGLGFPIASKTYFDRVGEAEFVKHPVSTGPYKIVDFKTGQYVDLEVFAGYWGGAPAIKQVRFVFTPDDSTRVSMLKTGEAEFITQVPYPLVSDLKNTKGLKTVFDSSGTRTEFIKFQNVNPKTPWYDIKVRQAIAISINREALVNDVMGSNLVKSYPGLGPGDIGYDPQLKHYEFNQSKAKSLLAEAGYPNGFDMDLNYTTGEITGTKETAEAVASYLSQVGIRAKLVQWEGPKWAEYNMKASGKPDMDFISMGYGSFVGQPDSTSGPFLHYTMGGPYTSYFNKPINDLILQARSTMDDNARGDLLKKVFQMIRADYAYIPLWTASRVYGMKSNIDFIPTSRGAAYEVILVKDIKIK